MTRDRKAARLKRARRTRKHIRSLGMFRMCVHRTPRHIYVQVLSPDGDSTVASASTVENDVRNSVGYGGNCAAAAMVGRFIAERAMRAGVEHVAFDRSGFRYHGRIRALADAAREAGLRF